MSKAISVGWTSSANFTPHSLKTSRIGFQRSANSLKPSSIVASDTGGNEYSRCQIDEPVKPLTTLTPSFWAARAVSFISWMAHSVFFLASPRTAAGTQSSVRASL